MDDKKFLRDPKNRDRYEKCWLPGFFRDPYNRDRYGKSKIDKVMSLESNFEAIGVTNGSNSRTQAPLQHTFQSQKKR
ncbi:hypothetical protein BpHYR1_008218 [Brachionus plicatilis]|uniref:Uncharacterized protein n=1 Tax=Brachionus plicatilis TaxID=10195 RepID=A0A3M7PHM9_BRAPC|nr:hypothetical protein BpHYR1_008218 [Brachionus plicatilis]